MSGAGFFCSFPCIFVHEPNPLPKLLVLHMYPGLFCCYYSVLVVHSIKLYFVKKHMMPGLTAG